MADSLPSVLTEQERRNRATRGHWPLFADHRRTVTDLLLASGDSNKKPATLCVLGAGNCNDLDLLPLLTRFGTIHLVDWDAAALADGLSRQNLAGDLRLALHGGLDLTGIAAATSHWSPSQPPPEPEIDQAIRLASNAPLPEIDSGVDVCASVSLLSQLIESVARSLGEGHPRFLELLQAVRRRHLEMLVELVAPGGAGLLITDLVSSESAPQILTEKEVALPSLVAQLIQQRNFFTGLNPAVLLQQLSTDPRLLVQVREIEVVSPWRWNLGSRTYVVYAIRFLRLKNAS